MVLLTFDVIGIRVYTILYLRTFYWYEMFFYKFSKKKYKIGRLLDSMNSLCVNTDHQWEVKILFLKLKKINCSFKNILQKLYFPPVSNIYVYKDDKSLNK